MGHVSNESSETSYSFDSWTLRYDGMLFHDGQRVHLPPKELQLLRVLLGCAGVVVSKDRLLDCIWPDTDVAEESLTRCMYSLRKLLGASKSYIKTVYGRGYCFSYEGVRAVQSVHVSRAEKKQSLLVLPFVTGPADRSRELQREVVKSLASSFSSTVVVMPAALAGDVFSTEDYIDLIKRLQPDFYLGVSCTKCADDFELSVELVRGSDHSLVHNALSVTSAERDNLVDLIAEAIAGHLPRIKSARRPYLSPLAGRAFFYRRTPSEFNFSGSAFSVLK
ncbi:DNA-binding winged-HTH domains [Pseudomonas sp. LAMO17WK12:I10]|uniref:winged helix-turn-helix domain-containing protein n=1 Tax=unclassified Pseudomonas TaxID=196821 RepID=UPI000BD67BDB|nr:MULTISPECIES: winged helix-turn-helix domain-containing protein [unclassified Pseudomonas]PXX53997.1 transcriptional regulator [Pseudomonas sp. LAMO17WK12:I9]SNY51923.1 DNA-binding winged-HTH domains [Pseudomonas sp. LAMO17WK12:I10]